MRLHLPPIGARTPIKSSLAALGFVALLTLAGCVNVYTGQENQAEATASSSPRQTELATPPDTEQTTQYSEPAPAPTFTAESSAPSPNPLVQAAPSPAQAAPPAQSGANFGVNCGTSSTGQSTIVIAEANPAITCDEAHGAMNGFNEQFFATGSLGPFTVGNYSCHSRDEEAREAEGRSVTCTRPGVRLEAMLPHPLGGFAVDSTDPYINRPDIGISTLTFDANGLRCDLHPQGGYFCVDLTEYKNYGDTQKIFYGPGDTEPTYASSQDTDILISLTDERSNLPEGQVIYSFNLACLNDGVGVTCTNGTVTAHITTANLGRP